MSDHSSKTPFPPKSPSGSILERIIEESIKPKSYGITHAIACTPFNETKTSTEPPNATEVTNCSPRIDELIQLAEPEYIIAAGKVAAKQLTKLGYEFLEIQHPTRIANQGEKGLVDLKRCILQIQEYLS